MKQNTDKQHWEAIYSSKSPQEVSWYQQTPVLSLKLIRSLCGSNSRIIDAGGGASLLVDHLLQSGYADVTVLDISAHALGHAKQRLGVQAEKIHWLEENITAFRSSSMYDLWHDRAVFHFLSDAASRAMYVESLLAATRPGSYVIIATFAKDGPTKCSGLDIVQYDVESIQKEFGKEFNLQDALAETHITPGGKEQKFMYFVFRRQ